MERDRMGGEGRKQVITSLTGATYPHKREIRDAGGWWNAGAKAWELREGAMERLRARYHGGLPPGVIASEKGEGGSQETRERIP